MQKIIFSLLLMLTIMDVKSASGKKTGPAQQSASVDAPETTRRSSPARQPAVEDPGQPILLEEVQLPTEETRGVEKKEEEDQKTFEKEQQKERRIQSAREELEQIEIELTAEGVEVDSEIVGRQEVKILKNIRVLERDGGMREEDQARITSLKGILDDFKASFNKQQHRYVYSTILNSDGELKELEELEEFEELAQLEQEGEEEQEEQPQPYDQLKLQPIPNIDKVICDRIFGKETDDTKKIEDNIKQCKIHGHDYFKTLSQEYRRKKNLVCEITKKIILHIQKAETSESEYIVKNFDAMLTHAMVLDKIEESLKKVSEYNDNELEGEEEQEEQPQPYDQLKLQPIPNIDKVICDRIFGKETDDTKKIKDNIKQCKIHKQDYFKTLSQQYRRRKNPVCVFTKKIILYIQKAETSESEYIVNNFEAILNRAMFKF